MTNGTSPPPTPAGVKATPPTTTMPQPPQATQVPRTANGFRASASGLAGSVRSRASGNWGGLRTQAGEVSLSIVSVGGVCTFVWSMGFWPVAVALMPVGFGVWAIWRDLTDGDGKVQPFSMFLAGCLFWSPLIPQVAPVFSEALGDFVETFTELGGDQE